MSLLPQTWVSFAVVAGALCVLASVRRQAAHRIWISAVGALSVALGGCSSTHLYRGEDDALASRAAQQYGQADVLGVLDAERDNLDAMLEYELAVADELSDLILKREWFRLVRDPAPLSESLLDKVIGKRKQELGLASYSEVQITDLIRLEDELRLLDAQLQDAAGAARAMFRVEFPSCAALDGVDALPERLLVQARRHRPERNPEQLLPVFFTPYRGLCNERRTRIDQTLSPFRAAPAAAGPRALLADAVSKWLSASQELDLERAQAQELRRQYKALTEQIEAADKARADLDQDDDGGKLAELSDKLNAQIERAISLGGALGLSEAATERIESIDALLAAIVDGEGDDAGVSAAPPHSAIAVASGLRSVRSDVRSLLQKRSLAPVAALIVEKQRQLALRQMAQARIARQARKVDLLRARYIAVVDEVELIRSIDVAAAQDGVPELLAESAASLLGQRCSTIPCGEIYRIFLKYVATVDSARRRQEHIDYQLIDLDHRSALDESQAAVRLWHALVETPVNELVAYHADGLRSEALADLFVRFSTLGAIAIGVND